MGVVRDAYFSKSSKGRLSRSSTHANDDSDSSTGSDSDSSTESDSDSSTGSDSESDTASRSSETSSCSSDTSTEDVELLDVGGRVFHLRGMAESEAAKVVLLFSASLSDNEPSRTGAEGDGASVCGQYCSQLWI